MYVAKVKNIAKFKIFQWRMTSSYDLCIRARNLLYYIMLKLISRQSTKYVVEMPICNQACFPEDLRFWPSSPEISRTLPERVCLDSVGHPYPWTV